MGAKKGGRLQKERALLQMEQERSEMQTRSHLDLDPSCFHSVVIVGSKFQLGI